MQRRASLKGIRTGPIALFVGAGALLYAGTVAWSGSAATFAALGQLGGRTVMLGTAVATSAYLLRFARWHVLLNDMGHSLPLVQHLRVYLSGLALTTSPGKIGETIRTVLLLPHGVRVPQSIAAFLADRLSDVLGVALIGVAAGWLIGRHHPALWLILVAGLLGTMLLRTLLRTGLWQRASSNPAGRNRLARYAGTLNLPLEAWALLWTAPRVALCIGLAVLAYGLQGLVFHAYVAAVGVPMTVAGSLFIFASSTLIGAASMIPGGLGAMEASLVYQLVDAGASQGQAVAATLAIRLSTLWTGMLLGSLMLLSFSRERNDRI